MSLLAHTYSICRATANFTNGMYGTDIQSSNWIDEYITAPPGVVWRVKFYYRRFIFSLAIAESRAITTTNAHATTFRPTCEKSSGFKYRNMGGSGARCMQSGASG